MAYDNNDSYEQGAQVTTEIVDKSTQPVRDAGEKAAKKAARAGKNYAKQAAKAGGKAGAKGVKAGAKAGSEAAAAAAKAAAEGTAEAAEAGATLAPEIAIPVLIIVIIAIIILLIFQQGSASSSYKDVFRVNAIGESQSYNRPETEEEAQTSIYDDQIARDNTESLVKKIHEVKKEDYQNIEKIAKKAVKKAAKKTSLFTLDEVDIEQSLQSAKKEASESSGWAYTYIEGNGTSTSSGTSLNPDDFYGTAKYAGCGGSGIYISKYKNRGWQMLLRPKDPATALEIANAAKQANAYNKKYVKYSSAKGKRQTYYKELEKVGFDFSKMTKTCYCTCSSFASVCARAGGIPKTYAKALTYSDKLPNDLMKSGLYEEHKGKDYANDPSNWRPGDLLVLDGSHCYTVVQSKNKIMLTESSGSASGTSSAAHNTDSTAETIAKTAEKYFWPLGTDESKYSYKKGGEPYNGFLSIYKKWYPGSSKKSFACCCHTQKTLLSEAIGHKIKGTLLPNTKNKATAKAKLEKLIKKYGFEVIEWDGKKSSLQRGDICTYRKTNGGGHVYCYLGNNLVGRGSITHRWFGRIEKWSYTKTAHTTKGKAWYFIIRHTDNNTVSSASTISTSYDELTTIGTIEFDTGSIKYLAESSRYCFQSFAYNNGKYYFQKIRTGKYGANGTICRTDSNISKEAESPSIQTLRHGNGLTYNTSDNMLYSVTTAYVGNNKKAVKIDPETLKTKGTVNLKHGTSAIAYDASTNHFVTSSGAQSQKAASTGYLYVYESDLKTEAGAKKIAKKRWATPGDICAYNGIIYVTISGSDAVWGKNHVDMYDENTGAYYGSYDVPHGEIEGVDFDSNGQMVLLFHASGGKNYVQFTGIQALSGAVDVLEPVTVLDMDILAAYNVSISNSATVMSGEDDDYKDGDTSGWLDKKGYSDISNKKVLTYWFGKNRGLINYEKDFSKKIDRVFKGNAVVKVDNKSKTIDKPDTSDWKLLLVNADNAVPGDYDANITEIGSSYTSGHESCKYIRSEVKDSLISMLKDCKAAGGDPVVISSYRTNDAQKSLYVAAGGDSQSSTAKPGHSEHETGMAVDIIEKGTESNWDDADSQAATTTQKWLTKHCAEYGFILRYPKGKESVTGIDYESWHYRYVGTDNAKKIMDLSCTLEEYLDGEVQSSEEDEKDSSKHFYKVVVGKSAETVTTIDADGNKVKKKIVPMTIKEKEVDELMEPLFGVDPDEDYVNSKTIKTAKQEEHDKSGTELKEGETSRLFNIPGGTATNLTATYSISDITGIMLYDRPEEIDPNIAAFPTTSSYGTGAFKLPLPPGSFTVTDTFGSLDPVRGGRKHDGLDLGASTGTPIYASLPGKVTLAKYYGGYGNCVIIETGTTKITYGHMSKILVKEGDYVQAGQVIGQVGNTGHSFGSHLHFEVSQNGKLVDPQPLLGL